jgi:hypothetical protein
MAYPTLRQTVLDATDNRALAEFYRQLLGWEYRKGDEPPVDEEWLIIVGPQGQRLVFAKVAALPTVTWPEGPVSQQLHLDFTVPDKVELDVQHERALALGATLLQDRSDDEGEPLRVYADPAGHPFCIFC